MIFEIVSYDTKVVPLKSSLCKLMITENQTRNSFGVVFHSAQQVKDLIDQLRVYADNGVLPE